MFQAQFYIFDKIKTEGGFQRIDEVHLRSEVMVPKSMIGRIIGKGGQNVSIFGLIGDFVVCAYTLSAKCSIHD